jgi:hypothetical protein
MSQDATAPSETKDLSFAQEVRRAINGAKQEVDKMARRWECDADQKIAKQVTQSAEDKR